MSSLPPPLPPPGVPIDVLVPFNDGAAQAVVTDLTDLAQMLSDALDSFSGQLAKVTDNWQGQFRGIFDNEAKTIGLATTALRDALIATAAAVASGASDAQAQKAYYQSCGSPWTATP